MKINVEQTFKNLTGETINVRRNNEEKPKDPLTLGLVLSDILSNTTKLKKGFRPLKSYELAQRCYGVKAEKEAEFDTSELIQIKELVEENPFYNAVVTAQALRMLETTDE